MFVSEFVNAYVILIRYHITFLRPSPIFSFSVECVSRYWVGRSDWKKNLQKKNPEESRNRRPWYPRMTLKVNIYIFGLTKCTIYSKKCCCFCSCFSLYTFIVLIFQIKRIISSEKWIKVCNYFFVFYFFLKMSKIWVGRTTLNGEKKEDGLSN